MKIIKNIFLGILAVIYFTFVIFNTILLLNINKYKVTQFDDLSVIIIKNNLTSENYKKGDVVLVRNKNLADIKLGDEIFVYKTQKTGAPQIDLGVVGEVHLTEEAISFENGATYSESLLIGSAERVIEKVGTVLGMIQSTWGFFFIVLIPSFLIFIYELYAIIIEVKLNKKNALN